MTEAKLERELNSVGRDAFVQHFHLFLACAAKTRTWTSCVEELVRLGRSNPAGASRRCGAARRIFEASREVDALRKVCGSKRVSQDVRAKARTLMV